MRVTRGSFSILTNGLSLDWAFAEGKNLFSSAMKSSEISKFASSSEELCKVVEPDVGVSSAASSSILYWLRALSSFSFLSALVYGAELQEVEYPVVTAHALRLIDDFTLLSRRMAMAVPISNGDSIIRRIWQIKCRTHVSMRADEMC